MKTYEDSLSRKVDACSARVTFSERILEGTQQKARLIISKLTELDKSAKT